MDLSWTADGVTDYTQTCRAVVEAGIGLLPLSIAAGRQWGRSSGWEGSVVYVLRNLVAGYVKAAGVREIEDIERVFESISLG